MDDYKKYRWFFTSSEKLVMGGKSAIQNDKLLSNIKKEKTDFIVMHTSEPGSPFCVLHANPATLSQQDIRECAIFTGCFSRAWREGKVSTIVDIFKASQLNKNSSMNDGTWGVYGKVQHLKVPLELVITNQKNLLRAIPEISLSKKQNDLIKICPGNIDKRDMLAKLELELDEPLSQEEVLSALPAGGFKVCRMQRP